MSQTSHSFALRFATARRSSSARFVALFALALGGACGGKVNEAPGGAPGKIDVATAPAVAEDAFCQRAVDEVCGQMGACCTASGLASPEVACRKSFLDSCTKNSTYSTAGGRHYDAATAGRCIAELHNAMTACTLDGLISASTGNDPCSQIYVGSAKLGELCSGVEDCVPSASGEVECRHGATSSTCALKQIGASGDACGFDGKGAFVRCGDGLYCRPSSARSTCAPQVASGGACDGPDACAGKLYCDPTGVCSSPKADGAACASTRECGSGACQGHKCVSQVAAMCNGVSDSGSTTGSGGTPTPSDDTPPPPR